MTLSKSHPAAAAEIAVIEQIIRQIREQFLTVQCSGFVDHYFAQPFVLGLIAGSGFDALAELLDQRTELLQYDQVGLLQSTVSGHAGGFVAGTINGVPVLVACGRSHLYEDHHPWETVRLTRVMGRLCRTIMTTAFVGSQVYTPGTAVLAGGIHNAQVRSPLIGANLERLMFLVNQRECPRFPGTRHPFHPRLQKLVRAAAAEAQVSMVLKNDLANGLRRVVGSGLGPHYESPDDNRILLEEGVQLLNMGSMIIEALVLAHMGVPLVGIAGVGNWATGYGPDGRIDLEEEDFPLNQSGPDIEHLDGMEVIKEIVRRDLKPLLPVYVRLLATELNWTK